MEIIFTNHCLERMVFRKITRQEVLLAIFFPDKILKKNSKYFVRKNIQRAIIEVVFEREKYINIITVYYL